MKSILNSWKLVIPVMASFFVIAQPIAAQQSDWAFELLNISANDSTRGDERPIIVAVIDDGFRLTHNALKGHIYQNPLEIPDNELDDDGNGFVDDIYGWDISDADPDPTAPMGREEVFYHGTYIATIITEVARRRFGPKAIDRVKIMPVKVLSDRAESTYIKDGYLGIDYAVKSGADIICAAWSGGFPTTEEKAILAKAQAKGVLVFGSAGNMRQQQIDYPAAHPGVVAVAAIDSFKQKTALSNYGQDIDISSPGEHVRGGHPTADNAYFYESGTSPAVAMAAGAAALVKAERPTLPPSIVKYLLMDYSQSFDDQLGKYSGKMGAGITDLGSGVLTAAEKNEAQTNLAAWRPKGLASLSGNQVNELMTVQPAGSYSGYQVRFNKGHSIKKPGDAFVEFFVQDTIWKSIAVADIPARMTMTVPGNTLNFQLKAKKLRPNERLSFRYEGLAIDSTTLYCSEIADLDTAGSLTDGSGNSNYANESSCKWLVTAPEGKKIKFEFTQIDTQANVDFIYLVDGEKPLKELVFAKFSGDQLPPTVFSSTNKALIWFVTDETKTGKGWSVNYSFIE